MSLPYHLAKEQERIKEFASGYGLDFFETIFEMLTFDQINQVASYGGFPIRYPHWRFGMEYERMSKSYAYGLSKIYEMVINNDPCYAYLLECNEFVDQKLVMAHVYGHCDFFKNNYWFSKTNRKMIDEMANHGTKIRRYGERFGFDTVEKFLDVCLSIDNLIDYHSPFVKRKSTNPDDEHVPLEVKKLKSKDYMEHFINPKEFIDGQIKDITERAQEIQSFPSQPVKDILEFLIQYAPLTDWQQDVLSIIREEAYYFAPQGQTKIMNEGWASYWHSTIMTQKALDDNELISYADHHSGTLATQPGVLNPYKLGIELFRDIYQRWDKGQFGKEYDDCDDYIERKHWDKKLGLGREKIFEVRQVYNDVTFIDAFLTEDFCHEHKMFVYDFNRKTNMYEISNRSFKEIKQRLLFSLTNFSQPYITITDANHDNRGELLLEHRHEGVDLDYNFLRATLMNINVIWSRPVNIKTQYDKKKVIIKFDGKDFKEKVISGKKLP